MLNCLSAGHLTAASDVYSFGVVLLELLTGRRSVDKTRPSREQNLADWARPMLKDSRKLSRIMDPRLEGMYSEEGAQQAAALAYHCLSHRPKNRPNMSDIVKTLEPLKDYNDTSIGTFVYTVPVETDLKKESEKESEGKKKVKKENGHHQQKHRLHHHNHKRSFGTPNSPTIYSETQLQLRVKDGINSPLHQRLKRV